MRDIDREDSRVPQDAIEIGDYVRVLTAIAQMCQQDELTFKAPHPLYPDQVLRLPRVQVLVYLGITFACQPCKSEEEVTIEMWRLRQYVLGYETQASTRTRVPVRIMPTHASLNRWRVCQVRRADAGNARVTRVVQSGTWTGWFVECATVGKMAAHGQRQGSVWPSPVATIRCRNFQDFQHQQLGSSIDPGSCAS